MASSVRDFLLGRSIRARVGRFLLLVGIVPLLAIGAYLIFLQRGVLSETANDNLANHATLEADAVARLLRDAATDIEVLAANPFLKSPTASRAEKSKQLMEAQEFFDVFEDITLIDLQGNVIDSTTYLFSGTWSEKSWFEEAAAGRSTISEAHLISSPSRLVVVFTAPVISNGERSAVVAGQMNMERVWEILDDVRIGNTGFLVAFDRNGNLISHPDKALLLTKLGGDAEPVGAATGTIDVPASGGRSFTGQAAPVGVLNWQVAALQETGETYALVNEAVATVAVALLAAVALAGVATILFSRQVGRAEDALRFTQFSIDRAAEPAFWITADARFFYVNDAACRSLKYTREELLSMTVFDIDPDISLEVWPRLWKELRQGGSNTLESRHRTKEGRIFPVEVTASYLEFKGRGYNCAFARDITERKQAEETIRHLAYHDALTDLPNRTLLKDRLTVAMAQASRNKQMLAVMFLDLDRFKVVNDTAGHTRGDQLLQSVGRQLNELVREGDTVARVGGDEFTLLLAGVAAMEEPVAVAERILTALSRPWLLAGHEFHISASIGITIFPADGSDAETLLRNADIAMYRAKEQGKNNYQLYTSTMNVQIAERLALENDLRHALEREEFIVYYQPQVDIYTGRIVGTEALVRWQHPERGLVLPGEFIPVAEDTGLIITLGEWVLRTACAQNKAWQEAGLPSMRMAVNLSAREFQQRDLAERVAQVLKDTGLDPHCLQLEITEGVTMQDVDFTISMLRDLREMGVQIAIDDFGTGHSALSYLKSLPIDVVKIDRSFVRDLTADPNDAAIATSIITMTHDLRLKVIAEGVETEEQLALLKQRRCDEMQGFLFSKPVPADAVRKVLVRKARRSRPKVSADSA